MPFFRRARETARPISSTRLRLEQLEARETPAVIAGFSESVFASGLTQPTAMAVAPDGRIFVAEKGGSLRVVQNGTLLATPFLTVGVNTDSERGLIGVALDPNFAANGFVYVYYTDNSPVVNRVSRFVADPNNPNVALAGETVLLDNIASTNGNHNGGALAFAADGTLFVGVGEAGVPSNAQDLTNLSGKVLRINSDGTVPANNPFATAGGGVRPEIWAFGLRNPFTLAVQPGTGQLFINDVGAAAFEEVNAGVPGANYGWPQTEGPNPPNVPGVTYPIYAYSRGDGPLQGRSIAGGAFYNPATVSFPASFAGDYFFGDFINSRIFVRDAATGTVSTLSPQTAGGGVVDLDVLPDGRLLYLSFFSGGIFQISAVPGAGGSFVGSEVVAAGTGAGAPTAVMARNADGSARFVAAVFPNYVGVRVATGDVTGDGVEDVIATSGPGGPPLVTVYNGASGQPVNVFFALPPAITLGLNVAAGDVNGDGRDDIIVGAASGFSAVAVHSGQTNDTIRLFFAFGAVPVGVNVGFANGDILTGLVSGPPIVATFTSAGQLRLAFLAAPATIPGGARVTGLGAQIVVGIGPALAYYDRFSAALTRVQFAFDALAPGDVFVG